MIVKHRVCASILSISNVCMFIIIQIYYLYDCMYVPRYRFKCALLNCEQQIMLIKPLLELLFSYY